MLTQRREKKIEDDCTRMLRAILNRSRKHHPTNEQLYDHLPLISKTIEIRRTRFAVHCLRSKNGLISDIFLWTPSDGRAGVKRLTRTYLQQIWSDTWCFLKGLPKAMNDRDEWKERVMEIRASCTAWWWWWWWFVHIFLKRFWLLQVTIFFFFCIL